MTYKIGKLPIHIERLRKGWPIYHLSPLHYSFGNKKLVAHRHLQYLLPMCRKEVTASGGEIYYPIPEKIKPPAFLKEA